MSESKQDATNENSGEIPAYAAPQEPSADDSAARRRPSLRPAIIAIGFALIITAFAQYFAPFFDHQNANLIGLACLAVASLFFVFSLHRRQHWSGHAWRVPLGMLAAVLASVVCFHFDGFSGEMMPQFSFRFGKQTVRELKTETVAADVDTGLDTNDLDAAPRSIESEQQSPQFLGPNRNGVYQSRGFAVPKSDSGVKVLWNQGIGQGWSSFAVVDGQAITLEQRDDQECLTSYRISDGELMWIQKHKGLHEDPLGGIGPRSTPTILGNRVYATSATGFLWCVDRKTGNILWTKDVLEIAGWDQTTFEVAAPWGYAGSPLLVDGRCILPLGGPVDAKSSASLVALDAETGEVIWKAGEDQLSYASPMLVTIADTPQIVSVNEKSVSGHLVKGGKQIWSFDWPGSTNTGANCSSAVPVLKNRLLVGKGYGGGSAVVAVEKNATGWSVEDVWRSNRILKTKFNHTCVSGNVGYGISNGSLQAVNLDDATAYWTQPRRYRAGQGQVVLAGDVLVMQDERGDVVLVDATTDGYNELLRIPALESKTWNIPTVAGRYLLVRNNQQAICFELPVK